jgi:hypothetical protein
VVMILLALKPLFRKERGFRDQLTEAEKSA